MTSSDQLPKNVIRICPVLSTAITYEKRGNDGKPVRVHELAKSPCIRGDCEMFEIGTSTCIFKKVRS